MVTINKNNEGYVFIVKNGKLPYNPISKFLGFVPGSRFNTGMWEVQGNVWIQKVRL